MEGEERKDGWVKGEMSDTVLPTAAANRGREKKEKSWNRKREVLGSFMFEREGLLESNEDLMIAALLLTALCISYIRSLIGQPDRWYASKICERRAHAWSCMKLAESRWRFLRHTICLVQSRSNLSTGACIGGERETGGLQWTWLDLTSSSLIASLPSAQGW